MADRDPSPPRLLLRWEALEPSRQAMLAYPVLVLLIVLFHLAFFPRLRDDPGLVAGYGIFEALPATAAVVVATAHERRKRARLRDRDADGVDG